MRVVGTVLSLVVLGAVGAAGAALAGADSRHMSFFVTHVAPGKGGDLGGLEGADAYCAVLAKAAGSRRRDWHAYLSTQADAAAPAINARDRIGRGPWRNANGVVVARDLEELHATNHIAHDTALDEYGARVNGRTDTPPMHDILTGSTTQGMAFPAGEDRTCHNYTSSSEGNMQMGHHDRAGPATSPTGTSWNSSHATKGCSPEAFRSRGGAGLLYCFAGH
ncbi:hypothetical protein GCM10009087_36400 [Sphingomonas oligophenolica]|uniref:Lectin n=1 Tax=Sphingomonas oligophenolica TaxID=301154 RepID=A0ABU9Y968_9SPHN